MKPFKAIGKGLKIVGKAGAKTADYIRNHPASVMWIPVVGPQVYLWASVTDKIVDDIRDSSKRGKAALGEQPGQEPENEQERN